MKDWFAKVPKILVFSVLTVLMTALALTGCGQNQQNPAGDTGKASTLSGKVTIAGSTSVQPLSEELSSAFMAKNGEVKIEVSGGGSGAGIKAAQTGTADIGSSSRELKAEETGIKPITVAYDGIAVIVNPQNNVTNLTTEQVKQIFAGKITNWKDVGGKDTKIVVVNREEGSGTRDAFQELVLNKGEKAAFYEKAIIQNSTGAVREAVVQDVDAVGYVSLGGLNNTVKALQYDGVEANVENVKNKKYTVQRPFLYLINEKQSPNAQTQAFLDFVLSADGQKVVTENGYVSIK